VVNSRQPFKKNRVSERQPQESQACEIFLLYDTACCTSIPGGYITYIRHRKNN